MIVLLVVLWYCYKRGREERLLREEAEAKADGERIEELPDDDAAEASGQQKNIEGGDGDEAAEAREIIPVIITAPEGEQQAAPVTPKEASTENVLGDQNRP